MPAQGRNLASTGDLPITGISRHTATMIHAILIGRSTKWMALLSSKNSRVFLYPHAGHFIHNLILHTLIRTDRLCPTTDKS
jgi:hypothetical protein